MSCRTCCVYCIARQYRVSALLGFVDAGAGRQPVPAPGRGSKYRQSVNVEPGRKYAVRKVRLGVQAPPKRRGSASNSTAQQAASHEQRAAFDRLNSSELWSWRRNLDIRKSKSIPGPPPRSPDAMDPPRTQRVCGRLQDLSCGVASRCSTALLMCKGTHAETTSQPATRCLLASLVHTKRVPRGYLVHTHTGPRIELRHPYTIAKGPHHRPGIEG